MERIELIKKLLVFLVGGVFAVALAIMGGWAAIETTYSLGGRVLGGLMALVLLVVAFAAGFHARLLILDLVTPPVTIKTRVLAKREEESVSHSQRRGEIVRCSFYLEFETVGEFKVSLRRYKSVREGDTVTVTYWPRSRTLGGFRIEDKPQ
ncbi:MAG: DUF2500 domain-containing protein [Planctomycetota bacterium]|jgi:hypothetical protein